MTNEASTSSESTSSRVILAVLALGVFCILIGMGTWQLQRLAWKEDIIAQRLAKLSLPPVQILKPSHSNPESYRRVTIDGRFMYEKELFVGPKPFRGRPGWHVVTPLKHSSGELILVDRGWIPQELKSAAKRKKGHQTDFVSVVGVASWPRKSGYFEHENDPRKGQWFRVDPKAMAAQMRIEKVTPYWIISESLPKNKGYPIGGGGIKMPANNHFQYALTWYGMALGLVVLSIVYWRQRRR
tara:strand:- start:36235 stop:36957 length:723 start_codon:yes stop_codon:yes gene_type:complete